jgi:hypothetical protein
VTLPQNWAKYVYKFLKTSPEELSDLEHTKNQNICNAIPKWKEVNLFLLTDTMQNQEKRRKLSTRI